MLVPGQELAIQIENKLKELATSEHGVRSALLIGGGSKKQQSYRLHQNANFLVATPGRLLDLIRSEKEWSREKRGFGED